MMAPVMISVIDSSAFWNTIASMASAVAVWAQSHAKAPADPVDNLVDRVRNPRRRVLWTMAHPFRAWRSR
jgi:hypothetical protein